VSQNEPGLFDLPEAEAAPTTPVIEDTPISPAQIASIRSAFDKAGIVFMAERQEVIQSCVIRRISNIRELYSRDVRQVLARIEGWGSKSTPTSGSAWDNREEDTWIDKL
jgi:DNA polymerase-3 subunit epsilon